MSIFQFTVSCHCTIEGYLHVRWLYIYSFILTWSIFSFDSLTWIINSSYFYDDTFPSFIAGSGKIYMLPMKYFSQKMVWIKEEKNYIVMPCSAVATSTHQLQNFMGGREGQGQDIFHGVIFSKTHQLKVPGPIASDFSKTFRDFGIRRKLIFFSVPLANFTAEKCTVWKILMKIWLVMVTIIKLTQ